MISLQKTYRFIALSMAVVIFLTTGIFTVDIHYCKGHIKSFSLIGKAKACYEIAACPMHPKEAADQHQENKKNCCHNESFVWQADLDIAFQWSSQIEQSLFDCYVLTTPSPVNLTYFSKDHFTSYLQDRPPPLVIDIPIFIQSFLL